MLKELILLSFCYHILTETIFSMDLNKGGYANKFEKFQDRGEFYAKDDIDQDNSDPVIAFTSLSKYSGLITKDWITSANGIFFIKIYFKGEAGKKTGGYFGYERSDKLNIYRTIGLDYEDFMDNYQFYSFTSDGTWNLYKAYLKLEADVKIKLILEQGTYFGITTKYYAAFKELTVEDTEWESTCPGTDQLAKQQYFTSLFKNMNLANKVYSSMKVKDKQTGTLTFSYLNFKAPCVVPAFYVLDSKKKVINSFSLSSDSVYTNYEDIMTWIYTFTLSQLETAGCVETQIECVKDGIKETCTNYTCDYEFHYYYDLGSTTQFATRQEQFDYSNQNSQVKYNSQFSVIVFKENSTVLNTIVYTKTVNNTICTGVCQINMDLKLTLLIKNNEGNWVSPSKALELTWGDRIYVKIQSDQPNYKLELMKIFITPENNKAYELGEIFQDSFIENQNSAVSSEFTFNILISGEAGSIQAGKQFNLEFLIETTPQTRLLAEEQNLPEAQISNSVGIFVKESSYAYQLLPKLFFGIFFVLLLLD